MGKLYTGILLGIMMTVSGIKPSYGAEQLNICTHAGFEPFVIVDQTEKKQLTGIDIDITLNLLKRLKQDAFIQAYPWKRLLASIKDGSCDVGFSLFDTEDRREYADFIFTVPIHYSTYSVFVRKGKEFSFNRVADFFGLRIAHNRGFVLSIGLEQAIRDGHIKRTEFDDLNVAIKQLETGRIDAIIDNEQRFKYYLKKHKKRYKFNALNIPFLPHHPAFMVFSKNSKAEGLDKIKSGFERELRKMHLDGTILKINKRYLD